MHALLKDHYEGDLKRLPFIKTEEYKVMSNKQKREWLDQQLTNYEKKLIHRYERPDGKNVSSEFIQTLWEKRKRATKRERAAHERPDGTLIVPGGTEISATEKADFYKWIKGIFDAPVQIRTERNPWDDKKLPPIPEQENMQTKLIMPEQGLTIENQLPVFMTSESILSNQRSDSPYKSIQQEYDQINDLSRKEFRKIYPKLSKEEVLAEIKAEAKACNIQLRSRLRSKGSRSRSRSRSRSKGSRSRSRSRSRERSRSRSRSPIKGIFKPKRKEEYPYRINVTTRMQAKQMRMQIPRGTRITQSQIPQSQPQVIITQSSPIIRRSSSNSNRSTPINSQIRSNSSPPLPQSNRTSRTSMSRQSSTGPQLVNMWKANSGLVINGEVNGFRLQIIFSNIHRSDWMTQATAQRCGIGIEQLQGNYYLEETYMDHRYNQRSRRRVTVRLGPDAQGRDVTIETEDVVPIVRNDNFYYSSQSLQDPRNRLSLLIGMDTIQHNNIRIRAEKLEVLIPNPHYQPSPEKQFYKLKALQYPDLSVTGK
jgi:hypothetical protein